MNPVMVSIFDDQKWCIFSHKSSLTFALSAVQLKRENKVTKEHKMRPQMRTKIIVIIALNFLMVIPNYGYFAYNQTECAFTGQCDGTSGGLSHKSSGFTLRQHILEGASALLKSRSDFFRFLDKVELSELNGVDYNGLQETLNAAVSNLEQARESYIKLGYIANITPYNPMVIQRLIDFDFDEFQKETGYNAVVFNRVKEFLIKGDVRGIYNQTSHEIGQVLSGFVKIQGRVDSNLFPDVSGVRQVNSQFAEFMLFAQYVADIFGAIRITGETL